ncbi:hypothetical protein [Streptomyces griseocarneus]|uniref:hypothetical protein n=1 Tax=Streptomyces griseocarneus TaxID=51201 RepID=UPI00167EAE15|nr:hypothetical protein [Streptomyces griseocarneus]MBZ6476235.1 hypothetical protein [Streptomyces griseocarneus]GHG63180.1 hypothetical protein GCM10018779_32530 [Streptomyces griseocarneus]
MVALPIVFLGIVGTLASRLTTQRLAENGAGPGNWTTSNDSAPANGDTRRSRRPRRPPRGCVTLNTSPLEDHFELNNFWYVLRGGRVTDDLRSLLDDARRGHRARYPQTRMRVRDDALAPAHGGTLELGRVGKALERLDGGIPPRGEGEFLEQARSQVGKRASRRAKARSRELSAAPDLDLWCDAIESQRRTNGYNPL